MSEQNLPRILIVEDDQTFRETVLEVLRDMGYKVKGARSLDKAAKRLKKHPFDLVLSDLNIGDHTGFEVFQVATEKRPDAKLVLMSGSGDPDLVAQAQESGAARFLPKPFRVVELLALIEDLLNRADQADQQAHQADAPTDEPSNQPLAETFDEPSSDAGQNL